MDQIQISDFRLNVFTIPTQTKWEADGTLEWNSTTMVLVELQAADCWSLGYTYGSEAIASIAHSLLKNEVLGQNALEIPGIWHRLNRAVRNDGKAGLAAMAIAAIDISLWDLKAKILGLPLIELLGGFRQKIEAYGSGGFTSYTSKQMEEQILAWQKRGLRKFKMKVGTHPEEDLSRVRFVRECIGDKADLMVDANEAYDSLTALRMAQKFSEQGVVWFEQPIEANDFAGMKELKDKFPAGMALTSGEYIYTVARTLNHLQARCVDVLQLDVTRNQGLSGFLKSAALCEAFNIPVSSHCAPSLHVALGCALPGMIHLEYFFDHMRIEEEFFEGVLPAREGFLQPDPAQPGLGLKIKTQNMERYKK